jgi:uncharacterized phage protein (TIGR02218 family)
VELPFDENLMPISADVKASLAQGTGIYKTLVKVTSVRSSDVLSYALHTRDIVLGGVTYSAMPFEPSKMARNAGTQVDNATITHLLGDLFTRLNLRSGKWSGAHIDLMCVDLLNLALGPVLEKHGRIGDVSTAGTQATTELRGLMQLLTQEIGDKTSKRCRYKLGDSDCTLNLTAFTFAGSVVTVHNNQRITVTTSKPDGYFKYGRVVFTSGLNLDLEMEIINNTGQMITFFLPLPYVIGVGDTLNLIAGDDKSIETCFSKFNNALNFGGEPTMPRREDIYNFPE